MGNALFITGTDTGVGKTVITALLAGFLSEGGIKVITQKWIQTGNTGVSEDIAAHMRFIGTGGDYIEKYHADMAPYVLEFPSSPHLAARLEKKCIDTRRIEDSFRRLAGKFDFVIVEGTGGPLVPIDEKVVIIDIARRLRLPALIVAGNRLGAINQTLLTVEALKRRSIEIKGIVFNRLSGNGNERILKDNMHIIKKFSGERVLGELGYNEDRDILYESFKPIGERIRRN